MLVLSRQAGQTVIIGEDLFVTVDKILSQAGQLSVCAPARVIKGVSGTVLEKRANVAAILLARDEHVDLGPEIRVTVVDIRGDKLRLGIDSPPELPVHRKEVYDAIRREDRRRKRGSD